MGDGLMNLLSETDVQKFSKKMSWGRKEMTSTIEPLFLPSLLCFIVLCTYHFYIL